MNSKENLLNEIEVYLKRFVTILSKPQFAHFEQIIKGMLFSELKSINSYSKSSNKNQSSLNRFMNSKSVNDKKINQLLVDFIESKLDSNKEKDFIFDDTLKRHKYANHIYGLSSHHDHLNGGYSRSHNLVTGGIKQEDYFYPTDCELFQRQVDVCESSTFITKIDIALAMLDKWLDKVDNVLMDSWYSSQEILGKIVKKEKFFFTMLKKNRNIKIGRKRVRQLQEWNKYIDPRDFKIITLGNQTFAVQVKICILPKVGKVKILFSKFYNKKTCLSKKIHYLCTNNLNLTMEEILIKYKDRWPIETFYKDIKQNLGFEKCILRKKIGIKRHFLMSFISHNLLIFSKKKEISCGETQRNLKYSYIENILQNYDLPSNNLQRCKKELMILC